MSKKPVSLLFLGLAVIAIASSVGFAQTIEVRVATGSDDAEQHLTAAMDVGSSDLEIPYEDGGSPGTDEQLVCLRFLVPVGKGMKVTNAYVEFTCDETKGGANPVNLIIEGQLAVNPPTFTTATNDLTGRAPWTKAQVAWTVENWTTTGQKSKTVNIAAVIQEIINQSGWTSGSALVLAFRDDKAKPSTGIRCADSYEDGADLAARLYIEISKAPATAPSPADGATDVPWDAALSWTAGENAPAHNVYFGTVFADVNSASQADPKGVLASQGQADAQYAPADALEYGQTYYWRIDEVTAKDTTKGSTWSFTIEPFSYPLTGVTATASSSQSDAGPENTVNGSGLNADGQHTVDLTQMWFSDGTQPNWIQYQFDNVYKVAELLVWNSNQMIEPFIGFGARNVTVEYSTDGTTWTKLEGVPEFAQGSGQATYTANTTVDFTDVMAKFVKLTIDKNWSGAIPQTGLSEVRFYHVPVRARLPLPADGATGVSIDADLNWRPGREATSHKVFFGTDNAAVAAGTAASSTVADHSYTPAGVEFGTKYFWKVDEIGAAGAYAGDVWSFTSQEYAPVDNFESYTDEDGNRIYEFWIDGVTNGLSGSTVGYMQAPFAEKTIKNSGGQSMPLSYDNAASPFVSEAELVFDSARNLTTNAADSLVVYFRGQAPGFAEMADGQIVMSAIGADIWDVSDQFRFAYKTLTGDATIVARVESIVNSNAWAKGGVMIRQSIEPGSVHAFMPITPSGGLGASFQHRLVAAGASTNNDNAGTAVAAPYWVKLERKGNAFSGFISPDGVTWTQLGTAQTIPMTGPVLIGLALCSHVATVPTSAVFSNVKATGNVTGSWQNAEIGIAQPVGNSLEGLYLSVKDSSGKTKVVQSPNAAASATVSWQQWKIPLSEFTSAGVKMNAVKSIMIGVGNKAAPKTGGTGMVFIDDIGYGRSAGQP